jgi:hypothetical protein
MLSLLALFKAGMHLLQVPCKTIVNNAGEEGSVVVGKLLELQAAGDANIGYNAATSEYVDLIKAGVIDPVKVREPNCCTCCSRSRSFGSKHARLGVTRTYTCICIFETC